MTVKKDQLARDAKFVFGTPEGERLVKYLIDFCHVYQNSFNQDPHVTAFNEGQRSVGLELISLIVNRPDVYKAEIERLRHLQEEIDYE